MLTEILCLCRTLILFEGNIRRRINMDVIYFIFGILQTLTGLAALHRNKQLPAERSITIK